MDRCLTLLLLNTETLCVCLTPDTHAKMLRAVCRSSPCRLRSASIPLARRQVSRGTSSFALSTVRPALLSRPHATTSAAFKLRAFFTDEHLLLSVQPPIGEHKVASDVCSVLDRSSSMDAHASMKKADGTSENFGISLLDLAGHGVKTVANVADSRDKLGLITFNGDCEQPVSLQSMDNHNKVQALLALEKIDASGNTDIWGALQLALGSMAREGGESRTNNNFNRGIFLLSDGESNEGSAAGKEPQALQAYMASHRLPCPVHTFAFGPSSNYTMLKQMATATGGSFAYIPDSTFLGTVMVNALANFWVTAASQVHLVLSQDGSQQQQQRQWLPLGSVQFGQSRDVVLPLAMYVVVVVR